MLIDPGIYEFGPGNGTLSVKTGRTGAAAKAGHNLVIQVAAWQATLEVDADPSKTSLVLQADATSLRVREGTGGMQALGDDDKANIEETIDDEVLKRMGIEFRSTGVQSFADGGTMSVEGDLTIVGNTCPIGFDLTVGDDGRLGASVVVKQTDWGITPYSTLFGTLKVVDEVEVEVVIEAAAGGGSQAHLAEAPECVHATAVESQSRHRLPSVDATLSSFLWALLFFLYLWFGMVTVGVSHATAVPFALVASFLAFVFVRTQGAGRKQ